MQKAFYAALALTLAFKFWLAHALPMTGDEAYFVYWGVYPAFGYYDHPPMVGWILALLLQLSRAEWVLIRNQRTWKKWSKRISKKILLILFVVCGSPRPPLK